MSIEPKHEAFNDSGHLIRMQTITDLRAARALVAKGWCQHKTVSFKGGFPFFGRRVSYCMTGAIGRSCGAIWPRAVEMVDAMYAVVFPHPTTERHLFDDRCRLLQMWNDEPLRTKNEVLAAFDRAIIHLTAA